MTRITIDTSQLVALEKRLSAVTSERIGRAEVAAVNQVTGRAYDAGRKRMIAGINLPDSYLRERMAVVPASDPRRPTAIIRASYRHTLLTRYGAVKTPSGVKVEVTRGSPKTIGGAFLMRLKNGNGFGVFVRDPGAKKPRILYGPSVYQLFRASIDGIRGEVIDDLERTVTAALVKVIDV